MNAAIPPLILAIALSGCAERTCSDSKTCWANREDVIQAAARCGVKNFEPPDLGETYGPWVPGENPDSGEKTRCIVKDLHDQGLMVTH